VTQRVTAVDVPRTSCNDSPERPSTEEACNSMNCNQRLLASAPQRTTMARFVQGPCMAVRAAIVHP
jgi:hypothetical protein